jgi:hypothetical protein
MIIDVIQESWNLSTVKSEYRAVSSVYQEELLKSMGKLTFEAVSVGGPGGQVAIIPLDESSIERGRLIACATDMARLLLSAYSHASHGGPTREDVAKVLKKAGLIE